MSSSLPPLTRPPPGGVPRLRQRKSIVFELLEFETRTEEHLTVTAGRPPIRSGRPFVDVITAVDPLVEDGRSTLNVDSR